MLVMLRSQHGEEQILLTLDDANIGLAGSPTKIAKASDKVRKGAGEEVTLDPEEVSILPDGKINRETYHLIRRKSGEYHELRRI